MAFTVHTATLNRAHVVFGGERGRLDKIDQWIDVLQGSGSVSLNAVVNDLVFLKRALLNKQPDKATIASLLVQLAQRSREMAQDSPAQFRNTFNDMLNTIRSIQ